MGHRPVKKPGQKGLGLVVGESGLTEKTAVLAAGQEFPERFLVGDPLLPFPWRQAPHQDLAAEPGGEEGVSAGADAPPAVDEGRRRCFPDLDGTQVAAASSDFIEEGKEMRVRLGDVAPPEENGLGRREESLGGLDGDGSEGLGQPGVAGGAAEAASCRPVAAKFGQGVGQQVLGEIEGPRSLIEEDGKGAVAGDPFP